MPPAATTNLGYTPPDGGWGWAVVFGAFISIGFSYAFPKSLTIYFKEIQEYFDISYSQIAWVSSVMLASMYAGGPVSSILVNRYGSRPVVMVGGVMVSAAMVIASFGKTIIHLYLCVGVIGGFGLAFNLQPALTIIGTYFQVKRPMANGLAMTGSPVVLCTLAPLNQFLFDSFGWRGSFLILGSIVLNCCVAGSLMRPVNKNALPKPEAEPSECNGAAAEEAASVPSANLLTEKNQSESKSQGCMEKLVDFSLFRHRGFLIYLVGNVVMFFGFFAPVVFLAPYAKHLGIDEYSAAFLLSIFALVDMFIRPATGLLGNTKWVRPRIQYFFSFAVSYNGVCHLLCPLANGYVGLVIYAVFFGLAFGMVSALLFEVLMDLVGAHRFSSAVGLVTIIECGPVLLGPPLSGALVDYFGDYKYMYYACGVFMLVPGIFFFIMHYFNYKRLDEEQRQAEAVDMRTCEEAMELKTSPDDKTVHETDG
ncbi:monocarboxylate transporter 2-like [Notolabrus celidotus]|uniref:monocarboxylate transporter 2-like n=1 Tax=Notolabrus celidotus TaxID=1203425 RepID=UPI0014904557|nr:monocarboxylate transporter 2-like [Notolabrus celidotus]XP_034552339.1 monocarboxylate transporter 2-like [Notolabrus celidotus]XP_034552340.1 monocarboxylate transporter 2-like [Notolabrus celidotus]XP_034552341.1 monocarboxylate transporter 2-like [Notolabrus celidotus]XP_034552342.1 monocarboxylate transporter 2-like [Notolabrus celidotus]XP_034552343.1 monocarboxylate transporter 2-like [Notolabrus celidotus]XP_034552344.1 monocarboxylate transporter 2-like [Notolabrus celidotus]